MFLIPLSQPESVALVVHALKMAGGEADCSTCPARRVCMKQCLTIAAAVENMLREGTLPTLGEEEQPVDEMKDPPREESPPSDKNHLKIIK
jgi:hypothetical protein